MRSVSSPRAVSISTGVSGRARIRRQTSKPSRSGSITSRSTAWKPPRGQQRQAALRARRHRHLEAVRREVLRDHRRQVLVVLDHEDAFRHPRRW